MAYIPEQPADDAAEVKQDVMQSSRPAVEVESALVLVVVESCALAATRRAARTKNLFMNMAELQRLEKVAVGGGGKVVSYTFSLEMGCLYSGAGEGK